MLQHYNIKELSLLHSKYIPTETILQNGELSRSAFGIALVEEQDGITVVLQSFCDLSTDLASAQKLAELCCSLQPSPEHLEDIIDDFVLSL